MDTCRVTLVLLELMLNFETHHDCACLLYSSKGCICMCRAPADCAANLSRFLDPGVLADGLRMKASTAGDAAVHPKWAHGGRSRERGTSSNGGAGPKAAAGTRARRRGQQGTRYIRSVPRPHRDWPASLIAAHRAPRSPPVHGCWPLRSADRNPQPSKPESIALQYGVSRPDIHLRVKGKTG